MILEKIAQAIEKSGKSRYQISKDTGVDNAVLCRIATGSGTGSCGLKTIETLCDYFGLELVQKRKRKRKKSAPASGR
jgi:ribosome-binding protein aMBF1 (putative translation factor)